MKKTKAAPLTSTLMARKGDSLTARSDENLAGKNVGELQEEIVRLAEENARAGDAKGRKEPQPQVGGGMVFIEPQAPKVQSVTMKGVTGLHLVSKSARKAAKQQSSPQAQISAQRSQGQRSSSQNSEIETALPEAVQSQVQAAPASVPSSQPGPFEPLSPVARQAPNLAEHRANFVPLTDPLEDEVANDEENGARTARSSAILGSIYDLESPRSELRAELAMAGDSAFPAAAQLGAPITAGAELIDGGAEFSERDEALDAVTGENAISLGGEPLSEERSVPMGSEPRESSFPFMLLFLLAVAISGAVGLWLTRGDEEHGILASGLGSAPSVSSTAAPVLDATRPVPIAPPQSAPLPSEGPDSPEAAVLQAVPPPTPLPSVVAAPVDVAPLAAAKPRAAAPAPETPAAKDPAPEDPAPVAESRLADTSLAKAPSWPEPKAEAPAAPPVDIASVEAVADAAAPPRVGYSAQLLSVKKQSVAEVEWQKILADHGDLLGDQPHNIVAGQVPQRGTYYRVRVGQFATSREARDFCLRLTEQDVSCLVIKN